MTERPATLEDVLGMVEALGSNPRMGRNWRKIALALSAVDLDQLTGLVVKGDVHRVTLTDDHAPCGCRNDHHAFTRDGSAWFGRGHWTEHGEAEKRAAKNQGHVVHRTVAYTDMEVVSSDADD